MNNNTIKAITLLVACLLALPAWGNESRTAPTFTVAGDVGELRLADFRGSLVYLDFWASWCDPCREAFKWLNEAHHKYADQGLAIIAINVDSDKALAAEFLNQNPVEFRIGYDPEGAVAEAYQLRGMPSSYLIDRSGQLRSAHVGYRVKEKEALESEVQRLLAE